MFLGAWNQGEPCHDAGMTERDRADYEQSVRAWRLAAPVLDELRHEGIRDSKPDGILAVIPSADLLNRLEVGLSAETGLIEQQAWFAKLRHG